MTKDIEHCTNEYFCEQNFIIYFKKHAFERQLWIYISGRDN